MNKRFVVLIGACALVGILIPTAILVGYVAPALSHLQDENHRFHDLIRQGTFEAVSRNERLRSNIGTTLDEKKLFGQDHPHHPHHPHHQHHHGDGKQGGPRRFNHHDFAMRRANVDLPSKFSADHLLPRYYQEDRGTCWAFATVGILEQSYRANGVAKGFMEKDQYVRFNEQAFGISMINACKDKPDVCDVVGDFVYHNSTEGGEVYWLYALSELYDELLPASVCPYTTGEKEHECPGMAEAIAANPIRYNIRGMETAYSVQDTKELMVRRNAPLAWSSMMHAAYYFFPCNDAYWSKRAECAEGAAVACPTNKNYGSATCARIESSMYTPDGEFFMNGPVVAEGGHAMNVVGYNDDFTTKSGHTGGFIIKNSWHDLTYGTSPAGRGARGSHSVAYWMQNISGWDERAICPGPLNPDNWISCVAQSSGPTVELGANGAYARRATPLPNGDYDISTTCLDDAFMQHLVDVTLQPAEFACLDEDVCSKDSRYRYFLVSYERTEDQELAKACMLQYDTNTQAQKTVCTPYHIPAQLAYFFAPIQSQLDKLKNDEDLCGYWFWPYDMLRIQMGLHNGYFATYFDIVWEDSSYIAKSADYPQYDYTWIKQSTFVQKNPVFDTPSPFITKRY